MTGLHVSAVHPQDLQAPACAWQIAEPRFAPERLAQHESVFAVGNGYLGLRGAPGAGTPAHDPGVILNGFHETWPIVYPEDAYGLARTGQTIVDVTDSSIIRLLVDDEPFDLASARLLRTSACSTCESACWCARSSGRPLAGAACSCARAGSRRWPTVTSRLSTTRSSRSTATPM